MKPDMWSLPQTIYSLLKMTHMIWIDGIRAWRLLHEDRLVKQTMQEGINHIKLTKRPVTYNIKSKNNTNCGILNDRTEGMSKIETWDLNKALTTKQAL